MIIRKYIISLIVSLILFPSIGFAQSTDSCLDEPFGFDELQNIDLQDISGNYTELLDYFNKEYILLELYEEGCEHCVDLAIKHNNDEDFQARVSDVSSCDYLALVRDGELSPWLQKIGGMNSFVGVRSRAVVDPVTDFYDVPTLYGGEPMIGTPTVILVNRQGELVTTKIGGVPQLFYDICLSGQECADIDPGTDNDEGGEVGSGSCACNGGGGGGEDSGSEDDGGDDSGPDDSGPDDSGPDDSGPDDSGPDDSGPDDSGPDDSGPDDSGPDDSGPDDSGPDDSGPDDSGPDDSGPDDSGPDDSGPDDSGPDDSGPDDSGPDDTAGSNQGSTKVGRLQIDIPWENERDIVTGESELQTPNSKNSYRITLKLISQRAWIILGIVVFIAFIYGGLKIAFSFGNKDKMTQGFRAIIFGAIALGIAIASYVIINLITNLL